MFADEKVTFRLIRCANAVYCAHLLIRKIRSLLRLQGRCLRFGSSLDGTLQKSLTRFANPCNLELLRRGPAAQTIEAWSPGVGSALEVSLARRTSNECRPGQSELGSSSKLSGEFR